jgi:hypothetical protein
MPKILTHITPLGLLLVPAIASAQSMEWFVVLLEEGYAVLEIAVPVLIALALALFLWGLVTFLTNSDDEQAIIAAKQKMIWGIVGLVVIISIWGIINLLIMLTGIEGDPGGLTAPGFVPL